MKTLWNGQHDNQESREPHPDFARSFAAVPCEATGFFRGHAVPADTEVQCGCMQTVANSDTAANCLFGRSRWN